MVDATIKLEQLFAQEPEKPQHSGCGSCGSGDGSSCGNGLEKIYPTTAIRWGYMRYIGEMSHPPEMKFSCGAKVVIQTKRGLEIGEQVSQTCSGCDRAVTRDQVRAWVDACGDDAYIFSAGRILREATAADLAEHARIQALARPRRDFCQQLARQQELPVKVVECESLFGGERIIFYFTAEERVDFRSLVRELAHEYRTRIELRQVGARDEARLLADYETCGREVCCKSVLKTLRPISMKMAKMQKATLDPSKVSGRCGRLKCCLRYEHSTYEELDASLPRIGERVRTQHGDGRVVDRQILTQLIQIRRSDETVIAVAVEDVLAEGEEARAAAPEPPARPTPAEKDIRAPAKGKRSGRRRAQRDSDKPDDSSQKAPEPAEGEGGKAGGGRRSRPGRRRRRRRRGGGSGSSGE